MIRRLLFFLCFVAACAEAQAPPTFTYTTVAPSGACVGTPPIEIVYFTGAAWVCASGQWTPLGGNGGGGGGGTPGGADMQIQVNKNGTFGGFPAFEFNYNTGVTQIGQSSFGQYITLGNTGPNGNYTSIALYDNTCFQCGTTVDSTGVYTPQISAPGNDVFGNTLTSGTATLGALQNGVPGQAITVAQNGGGAIGLQVNSGLGITGQLNLSNGAGTSGQVPTSQGAGQPVLWGNGGGGGGGGISALTGDVIASGTGSVAAQVAGINGVLLAPLATGLLQNNTGSGAPSIANTVNVSGNGQFGGFVAGGVYTATYSASPNFDLSQGNLMVLTLTGDVTNSTVTNAPTSIDDVRHVTFRICQDGTGGHLFPIPSWSTGWNATTLTASGCTDTITTVSSAGIVVDGFNAAFCNDSDSPAVCGQAGKGYIAIPAGTNPTLQINTAALGPQSIIMFGSGDQTTGPAMSPPVVCGTSVPTGPLQVTARVSGTSFTVQAPGTIVGNYCTNYVIVNP